MSSFYLHLEFSVSVLYVKTLLQSIDLLSCGVRWEHQLTSSKHVMSPIQAYMV